MMIHYLDLRFATIFINVVSKIIIFKAFLEFKRL